VPENQQTLFQKTLEIII